MKLKSDHLRELARLTIATRPQEIDCEAWLGLVGQYVELKKAGQAIPDRLLPVVQHLAVCPECVEELDAIERGLTTKAPS